MASKTITSDPFLLKLPGTTKPLNFKTVTTFEVDINGNPVEGTQTTSLNYQSTPGGVFQPAATSKEGGKPGSWILINKANSNDPILGSTAISSLQTPNGVLNQQTQNSIIAAATKAGIPPEKQKPLSATLKNTAAGTGNQPPGALDETQLNFINKDLNAIKSRDNYGLETPIVYPIGLKSEYQDCIKFSIIKYQQSGLKGFGQGNRDLRRVIIEDKKPGIKDRQRIGTIVLPIPGGISDSNRVSWSDSKLSDLDQALGKLFTTGITERDIGAEFKRQATAAAKESSGVRTAIIGKLAESVTGGEGIMQRQFGAIINPNLELLFNSPDLRQFSFSFRLSPRSGEEAKVVKKIIRAFKQSMSVKRSASSFLLQTPHTFAISYIFKNKDHPYLNKFKECALTNCNVNYTPEATYMSFEDGAMVSYQLDLTFQELEPIYDDDYSELDTDTDKDNFIGY